MATWVERAQKILEGWLDALPDAAQQQRIANAFISEHSEYFTPVDPLNPTNEEKARCFVRATGAMARKVLEKDGYSKSIAGAAATAEALRNTAVNTAKAAAIASASDLPE